MIYLFSNRGYGAPFWRRAAALARSGGPGMTVVFSGRRRFLKQLAFRRETSLPLKIVPDVNAPGFLKRIRPGDCGIIAGFNQIFRAETIERFRELVNFHPSVLPLYRGPVPSHWCIENGEESTGYSLHRVTKKIDAGEVLFQDQVSIGEIRDAALLDRRIAEAALPVFERWIAYLDEGGVWEKQTLDARALYGTHLDYASFPDRPTK